jgi:hypothetical protein
MRAFAIAVANYTRHDAAQVLGNLRRARARRLPRKKARAMLSRCGTVAKALAHLASLTTTDKGA